MTVEEIIDYFGGQSELAKQLNMSRQAIFRWINDDAIPEGRLYQLEKLSKGALTVPMMKGEEEMERRVWKDVITLKDGRVYKKTYKTQKEKREMRLSFSTGMRNLGVSLMFISVDVENPNSGCELKYLNVNEISSIELVFEKE